MYQTPSAIYSANKNKDQDSVVIAFERKLEHCIHLSQIQGQRTHREFFFLLKEDHVVYLIPLTTSLVKNISLTTNAKL